MVWERRASERASAGSFAGLIRADPGLALALAALGALGACRQTVLLDPPDRGAEGGAGASGAGPAIDARTDATGTGGASGGTHFDAGRLDGLGFCFGGPIQIVQGSMHIPDVIVSVDRSSGMQSWFGSNSRLQVIHQQVRALISKYKNVRFGYEEFPSTAAMCGNGQGCCAGEVAQPITNNLRAIDRIISICEGDGPGCDQAQRPIADALSKCYDVFKSLYSPTDTGHRYVLLLTSGDPTCGGSDAMSTACDNAVTQVTKLSRASVNTAVFGIGDGAGGSACLDQLAVYGGLDGGGASPLYHLARTPNDLSAALEAVVETIAEETCKIDVRSPPADQSNVQLLFDGMRVPMDGVDGWTFDQNTSLTLTVHGSYCRSLIQNTPQVALVAGCPFFDN